MSTNSESVRWNVGWSVRWYISTSIDPWMHTVCHVLQQHRVVEISEAPVVGLHRHAVPDAFARLLLRAFIERCSLLLRELGSDPLYQRLCVVGEVPGVPVQDLWDGDPFLLVHSHSCHQVVSARLFQLGFDVCHGVHTHLYNRLTHIGYKVVA